LKRNRFPEIFSGGWFIRWCLAMIQIKKLVLKNFKSFRKAEIPVARGFTAIVGSNGSGKSNILDALLFVLGISSLKALRASRMTDLVNNQAQEDYAKVEMELEDSKKGKKWMVSRTVDKQGRAVVRLDDKRVALNEVTALLEELGIKPEGHNIVVQGDITRIIEMNDVQRREMIDDVAGIREFDEKREESFKELGKVDQRIKEVRIVLSERETYLEELSKEREAAMQFNRLTEEVRQSKATLFKSELGEIQAVFSKNNSRKNELEKELQERSHKKTEEQQELEFLEQKTEEANQQLIAASEKTYSGIGMLAEEKRSEKKVREERKSALQQNIQKNGEKIVSMQERLVVLESEIAQKRELLEKKNRELSELEQSFSEERKNREEKRGFLAKKGKELASLEEQLRNQELLADEQRQLFFEKQAQWKGFQKTVEFKKQSLNEWLAEKKRLDERLEERQKRKNQLDSLLQKNSDPEGKEKALEEQLRETGRQQAYSESQADSLRESIRQLEKTTANCPVCDSKLSESNKQKVLDFKKKQLAQTLKAIEAAREKRKIVSGELQELELVLKKKRELEFSLADFEELKNKAVELENKVSKLRSEIQESPLEKMESELEALQKKLHSLETEEQEAREAVDSFKEKNDFSALTRISDQLEAQSRQLGELRGQKRELELEVSLVLEEEKKNSHSAIESLVKENASLQERLGLEEREIGKVEKELEKLELELAKSEKATKELSEQKQRLAEKLVALKQRLSKNEAKTRETELALNSIAIENSKLEVRKTDLEEEARAFEGVPVFDSFDARELRQKLPQLEKQLQKMGAINQRAVENFGLFEQELLEIKKKSDKLEEERLAVLDMIKKIEDRRTQVFMDCFNAINRHFNEIFFTLADGQGRLSLTDPEKPLESGLLVEASMKGKPIYSIDSMSGGEKTLTGLAFLFAIQLYTPAPFYVFDEADAALDKENSMKLGKIIAQISQGSQFIGITHNDTIVREADQIIGVALNEQKSSVVGLRLREKTSGAS
jgi:chromosome segregation protein